MREWVTSSIKSDAEKLEKVGLLDDLFKNPEQKIEAIAELLIYLSKIKRVQLLVPNFPILPAIVINFLKIFKCTPEANIHLVVADNSKSTNKVQHVGFAKQHNRFDMIAAMAGKDTALPNHALVSTVRLENITNLSEKNGERSKKPVAFQDSHKPTQSLPTVTPLIELYPVELEADNSSDATSSTPKPERKKQQALTNRNPLVALDPYLVPKGPDVKDTELQTSMRKIIVTTISCFPDGINPGLLKAILIETQLGYLIDMSVVKNTQFAQYFDKLIESAIAMGVIKVNSNTGFYHFAKPILGDSLGGLLADIKVIKSKDPLSNPMVIVGNVDYDLSLKDRSNNGTDLSFIDVLSSIIPHIAADIVLKKKTITDWDLIILQQRVRSWQEQGELDKLNTAASLALTYCEGNLSKLDLRIITDFYILKLKAATPETVDWAVASAEQHLTKLIEAKNTGTQIFLDDKIIELIGVLTEVYGGLLNNPVAALGLFTKVKKVASEELKLLVDDPTDPATFRDKATQKKIFRHSQQNPPDKLADKIALLRMRYISYQAMEPKAGTVLEYIRKKVLLAFDGCSKGAITIAGFVIAQNFTAEQLSANDATCKGQVDKIIAESANELRVQFALAEYGTKLRPLALLVGNPNFAFRSLQVFTDLSLSKGHFTTELIAACAVTAYFHLGGLKKKAENGVKLIHEIGESLKVITSPVAVFNYYLSMHRIRIITPSDLEILIANLKLAMRQEGSVMVGTFARFVMLQLDLVYGADIPARYARKCEIVALMLGYTANNPDAGLYLLNCALVEQDQALLGIDSHLLPATFIDDMLSRKLKALLDQAAKSGENSGNKPDSKKKGITVSPSIYASLKDGGEAAITRYGEFLNTTLIAVAEETPIKVSLISESERILAAIQKLFAKSNIEALTQDERSMLVLFLSDQLAGLADMMLQKLLAALVHLKIDEAYSWCERFVNIDGLLSSKDPMPTKAPILAAILTVLAVRFRRLRDVPECFQFLLTQRFTVRVWHETVNQLTGAYAMPLIARCEVDYIVEGSAQYQIHGISATLADSKLRKGVSAVLVALQEHVNDPNNDLYKYSGADFALMLMVVAHVAADTENQKKGRMAKDVNRAAYTTFRNCGASAVSRTILSKQPDIDPTTQQVAALQTLIITGTLSAEQTKQLPALPEAVLNQLKMLPSIGQREAADGRKNFPSSESAHPVIQPMAFYHGIVGMNPDMAASGMVDVLGLTLRQLLEAYLPVLSEKLGLSAGLKREDLQVEVVLPPRASNANKHVTLYRDLFVAEPHLETADPKLIPIPVISNTGLFTVVAYQNPGIVFHQEECFGGTTLRVQTTKGLIIIKGEYGTLLIHTPSEAVFTKTQVQVDLLLFAAIDGILKQLVEKLHDSPRSEMTTQHSEDSSVADKWSINASSTGMETSESLRILAALSALESWANDGVLLSQSRDRLEHVFQIIRKHSGAIATQLRDLRDYIIQRQDIWLGNLDKDFAGLGKNKLLTPIQLALLNKIHLLCVNGFITHTGKSSVLFTLLHAPTFKPSIELLVAVEATALRRQLIGVSDGKSVTQRFNLMIADLLNHEKDSVVGGWEPHTDFGKYCKREQSHENLFVLAMLWIARSTQDETSVKVMELLHIHIKGELGQSINLPANIMSPIRSLLLATPQDYEVAGSHILGTVRTDTYARFVSRHFGDNIVDRSKAQKDSTERERHSSGESSASLTGFRQSMSE